MQRPVVASARTNDDHVIINIPPQHSPPHADPRRRTDQETRGGFDDLAAAMEASAGDSCSNNRHGRRGGKLLRFKMTARKWIHAIPFIVAICFFILWWYSYPVVINKDGTVMRILKLHKLPPPLNEDYIDFTFLSAAAANTSPPYAATSNSFSQGSSDTSSIASADLTFLAMTSAAAPSPYGDLLQEPSDNAASVEAYSPLSI